MLNTIGKEKLLVIHPALAPYRINYFTSLTGHYDDSFVHDNIV